ncbi:centromere protein K [Octodon degus]|uniref:Centromere protein K n=1 Tax=Octodon degus TaxID=10160 RepID=A0A6P3EPI9_OCTDE|nr:centromere protein K [Octodon degus]
MEVVTDTEEELMRECEEMWKDMEECQNKLSLIGTETLSNSNAQLSLLIMQVKCLTAELSQWHKETPKITPLTEDVLITLGRQEFQKLRHDLEMVLSTIQSKNEKLKEDLEREQQWLDEQQQIMKSLNVLHDELKNQVVTFSESRIFNELKTKILNIKEFKEKLLITLGEFLEDHFPLPDGTVKKKVRYRKLKSTLSQFSGKLSSLCFLQLDNTSHRFWTQNVASPVTADLIISVIVVGPDGLHQLSQRAFVFRVDLREGDSGTGLPVDQTPQLGLPLDAVRDPRLATQDRQEHDQLEGGPRHVQSPPAEPSYPLPEW